MRRAPRNNVPAADLVTFLDRYATIERDMDGIARSYVHGVWVDDITKREIRRYRNGQVATIRPTTLNRLLNLFNLENTWPAEQQ